MARHVFFSFHYANDVWRSMVVRNHWVTKGNMKAAGFFDAAEFESVQRKAKTVIESWIREQMRGASVTAVLVGSETASRPWVNFEIAESIRQGMGLVAVHVATIGDRNGRTASHGTNPLASHRLADGVSAATRYKTYWWTSDDGYENFGSWVDEAARIAGR